MAQVSQPLFLSDRDKLSSLQKHSGSVVAAMRSWGLGRIDKKESIHFCGLVHLGEEGSVVFLPREARTGDPKEDLATASLTMRALARFGAETSKREFEDDGKQGNPGVLSVIKRLSDDFRDYGLLSERKRQPTRNSGKPDWIGTLKREIAMADHNGQPVFTDIRTSRTAKVSETLLAQIQAAVIKEIHMSHGWWLSGVAGRQKELFACARPLYARGTWARKLDALLPSLYSARSIFLAEYLRYYLRETRASEAGSLVFGVSDFHSVWETMLREALVRSTIDTMSNWNSKLPKPVYLRNGVGSRDAQSRGMQTDIILEDPGKYIVVDAKYYAATSAQTAPGWPDIAKQLFYEKAMREVVGSGSNIGSAFVFPSHSNDGPLEKMEIINIDGTPTGPDFTNIACHYVSVREALHCYVKRIKGVSLAGRTL